MTARPDVPVPSNLQPLVGPARRLAQDKAGLLGFVPFRLTQAICSADGRAAALAFESVVGSIVTHAVLGFPVATDAQSPGAVITIVGVTADEFASSPDGFSSNLVEPCDGPS